MAIHGVVLIIAKSEGDIKLTSMTHVFRRAAILVQNHTNSAASTCTKKYNANLNTESIWTVMMSFAHC